MNDDNIFKQKLYHHTLPVKEGIWEAIEAKLPPVEKKKRFPFFWLVLFGSILASGALMLNQLDQNSHRPNPSKDQSTSSIAESAQHTQSKASDDMPRNTDNSGHLTNETSPSTSGTIEQSENASNVKNSSPLSAATTATPFAKTRSNSTNNTKTERLGPTSSNTSETQSLLPSTPFSLSTTTDGHIAPDHSSTSSYPTTSVREERSVTTPLPLADVALDDDDFIPFSLFQPDPECYVFGGYATGFALSAELLAGPGFSVRSFEGTGGESQIYADARNETERKQYAWTVGARLNLHLHSGLGAKLGLSYHQAGDILDYRDSLATQSSTRIDSFWASDGTFLYADTVRVFIPGTLVKKIHNTYRQVDIPLLLSYELILARSIIMINAGPVFNLTSSHSGQILDTSLHPRPLAPDGTPANQVNAYRNQLGISLYLGAGVLFPLGSHTSAVIEPRFLYRIKPVTLPQYALKEHRHFAGLHLGLRYHFN